MAIQPFKPNIITHTLAGVRIFLLKLQGQATPTISTHSGGNVFGNYFLSTSRLNLDVNQIYQSSVFIFTQMKISSSSCNIISVTFRRLFSDAFRIEIV